MLRTLDSIRGTRQSAAVGERQFLLTSIVLVGLACALRLFRIGSQELWADEAYSYLLAAAPEWFGPATLSNNTPPLYHILLRGWMMVAGEDETGLRLFSALFGALFVVTVICAGRVMFRPTVGLWSGGFAAIAPIHIFYSQEARAYALMIFALMLAYVLLWRAMERNTAFWWASASLAGALALYSHSSAVLGLVPTVMLPWAVVSTQPARQLWTRYVTAMAAACLLFSPWLVASVLGASHQLDDASLPWLAMNWIQIPPPLAIPKSLEILGLGGHAGLVLALVKQFRLIEYPRWAELLGLGLVLALLLWSAVPWGDNGLGVPHLRKRKVWLWTTLLLPLGALWLGSYLIRPMYIVGRYDLVVFPAFTLLIGLALAKLQSLPRKGLCLAFGVAFVFSIPLMTKLYLYYRVPESFAVRQTVEFLGQAVRNNDALVFTGARGQLLLYYLSRLGYRWDSGMCRNHDAGRLFQCRFIPRENERTLLVYDRPAPSSLLDELGAITAGLPPSGTLWLAFQRLGTTSDGRALLDPDVSFIDDVSRLGLSVVPELSREGIYAFRRSEE